MSDTKDKSKIFIQTPTLDVSRRLKKLAGDIMPYSSVRTMLELYLFGKSVSNPNAEKLTHAQRRLVASCLIAKPKKVEPKPLANVTNETKRRSHSDTQRTGKKGKGKNGEADNGNLGNDKGS